MGGDRRTMKTFKLIYYPIYILTTLVVLWIAIDMFHALEIFQSWGWFKYFSELPGLGRNLLWVLSALLVIEIVIENLHLKASKKQLKETKKEIEDLKNLQNKLYEKAQEELTRGGFTELEIDDRD